MTRLGGIRNFGGASVLASRLVSSPSHPRLCNRMQQIRAGRGFAAGEFRRVWIVTIDANFTLRRSRTLFPMAAGAPVCACFPVAIRRTVATAAEQLTVREFHLVTIACL